MINGIYNNNDSNLTMTITNTANLFVLDISWVPTSLILIFVLFLKLSNSF